MTEARQSLKKRLILAYVLVSLMAGGLVFALSNWSMVRLEAQLQEIDMGIGIERIREEIAGGVSNGRPGRFFHGPADSEVFPAWVRSQTPGFYKLTHDGRLWHLRVKDEDGERFVLLRDYTDYEHGQARAAVTTLSSLLGIVVLALLLGLLTTRRVVRPIERLARGMSRRQDAPRGTRLAPNFPPNEIGLAASAFDQAYNRLEHALERERLFTADVGHELRTPLMVVSSSCEVLADERPGDPDLAAELARIQDAVRDMHQRLDTFLMLARDDDGAGPPFPRATWHDVAHEQLAHWQPQAERLRVALTLDVAEPSDARYPLPLLRAVAGNLIRNALQYAGRDSQVQVRVVAGRFEVEDNGPGIEPARLAQLFEPFTRGPQPNQGNLGLGLSLVQRICLHQGWTLEVHSEPGASTVFAITCN